MLDTDIWAIAPPAAEPSPELRDLIATIAAAADTLVFVAPEPTSPAPPAVLTALAGFDAPAFDFAVAPPPAATPPVEAAPDTTDTFVFVTAADIAPTFADLVIETVRLSGTGFIAGDTVSLTYDVVNRGAATAGASDVAIYLSRDRNITTQDILLDTDAAAELLAGGALRGQFETFKLPENLRVGTYYIALVADSGAAVAESGETNNVGPLIRIDVTGTAFSAKADLVITNATLNGTSFAAGATATAHWDVANIGEGKALVTRVGIYLSTDAVLGADDLLLDTNTAINLAGGAVDDLESEAFFLPGGADPGDYFIILAADHLNRVSEVSEDNNADAVFAITLI